MSHERGAHKSWVSRICYAIGNLGQAAYYNALSTFFVTYYAAQTLFRDYEDSEAKAMIAIITALVFIIRIAEIFIDPLLGNLVDNTTSRWGRFKPWQVIGGGGSVSYKHFRAHETGLGLGCRFLFGKKKNSL